MVPHLMRCIWNKLRFYKKRSVLALIIGLICLITTIGLLYFVSPRPNEECHVPKERMDAMRYLAKHVILSLEAMNETYWIDHGTLLGAVRRKDILPHDYDVDIGRIREHWNENAKGNVFAKLTAQRGIHGNLMAAYMFYGRANESKVTCDMFRYHVATKLSRKGKINVLKEYWPQWVNQGALGALKNLASEQEFPVDLFLPTVRIPFLGMMVRAPGKYQEVIRRRYPYTWFVTFPYKWKCWIPFLR